MGQTLTATQGSIADPQGIHPVSWFSNATTSVQWIGVDSGTDSDISSATGRTYALVDDDLGKQIKVKVDFADGSDNAESRTSAAFPSGDTVKAAELVGNVGQTDGTLLQAANISYHQAFTTGTNTSGYTLTSVEVRMYSSLNNNILTFLPEVVLYEIGTGLGTLLARLTTTTTSYTIGSANYTFTPAAPVDLDMSTPYRLQVSGPTGSGAQNISVTTTLSDNEDGTPAAGWSIANARETYNSTTTLFTVSPDGDSLQIRVDGTAKSGTTPLDNGVSSSWNLTPAGLTAGAEFRLLFLSSTKRDALSSDIADYNTFVQARAAAGHADIQAYSAGFRAIGCTAAVDARDNTSTTGTGVPIYWLDGTKVADNYTDFYDGDWDDEANDTNESGTDAHDTTVSDNYPITGCMDDGTESFAGAQRPRSLGAAFGFVRIGRLNSSVNQADPIDGNDVADTAATRPMYGLSAVFEVTDTTFISNTGQTSNTGSNFILATAFTTGASTYTLSSVGVDLGNEILTPIVSIYGDSGTAPGWSLGNSRFKTTSSATSWSNNALPILFQIRGKAATGLPTITGTAQVGYTLTADTSAIMDADGLTNVSYTYQWIRVATDNTETRTSLATAAVTADTTPPMLVSATVTSLGAGGVLRMTFDETPQRRGLLPAAVLAAITVTVDGVEVNLAAQAAVDGIYVTLQLPSGRKIRSGQAVVITYTDPTSGNDTNALQDTAGNDVATFTTGLNRVPLVINNSTVAPVAPGAPTGLTAVASGSNTITLFWTAPADNGGRVISGYKIEISPNGTDTWTTHLADTTSTNTTYEHTGLAAGTTRHYRVSAINTIGTSAASNVDDATTVVVNNPPAFSANTAARSVAENTAAGQNVGAALTATDANSDTLTYTLEGADAASFDIASTSGQILTKAGVTYNHEATSTYTVIVKADDGNGGTDTVTVTITVTDVAEPPGVPAVPLVTATSGSTTSLDVTWTAPTNTGPAITSYDLQYREGTSGSFTAGPQDETGTSAAIASLMASTSHQVQVRATNAEGDGAWSGSGTGRTGASVPGAPTSLSAIASGSTQIDLSWTAPGSDGGSSITGYKIEISSDSGANWTVHVATTGNPATTYSHIGLAAGTTRHYRVSAINANGAGAPSNTDGAGDDSARGGRRGDGLLERAGERDVPDRADAADVHVEGNRRLAGRRRRARSVRVRVAAERVRVGPSPHGDRDAHRRRCGPDTELRHGAPPHREGARERDGVASVHSYPEDTSVRATGR